MTETRLDDLLRRMVQAHASDLYVIAGAPPALSVDDDLVSIGDKALTGADIERLLAPVLEPRAAQFARRPELDVGREVAGAGRFRLNVYRQRGQTCFVARHVQSQIPSVSALGLPSCLERFATAPRGLVLVTGAAGSGKSTTLAAMIEHRSATLSGHIVTIEDPLEFVHPHRRSLVSQREVGVDTLTFHDALRSALRQAPDVLLVGEVRDRETAEAALHFAETGHLVLATLHATNTPQAVDRLLNLFPAELHVQVALALSLSLVAIVGQRLLPRRDGHGRIAVVEVLLPTERVREHVRQRDADGLRTALREGAEGGMASFDEALYRRVKAGELDADVATAHADAPNDLALRLRLERAERGPDARMRLM